MPKPYLDINGQIQNLSTVKGLIIHDTSYAQQKLGDISYLSLIGGYKVPFFDGVSHKYINGVTFEDIVSLYQFDKNLRLLTFGCLTSVEEKIRQQISDAFCKQFGEQQSAYLDPKNYRNETAYAHTISGLVNKYLKNAAADKDHDYIVHQRTIHHNVPLWATVKVLTFGTLSKMYSVLQYHQRMQVTAAFPGLSDRQLAAAIDCMTYFRNICAHNERLYSFQLHQRAFPDTPLHSKLGIPKKGNEFVFGKKDYFGLVIALRYVLPADEFLAYKRSLKKLIDSYSKNNTLFPKSDLLSTMGFPQSWENITRYRKC